MGRTFDEFIEFLNNDSPRDILQDKCIEKIKALSTEKLELINNLFKAYWGINYVSGVLRKII